MDRKIAHQINGWICHVVLAADGIPSADGTALEKLADISLPDMIAARDIVLRDNEAGVKNEHGHRVYECTCEDDLIAEVYIKAFRQNKSADVILGVLKPTF